MLIDNDDLTALIWECKNKLERVTLELIKTKQFVLNIHYKSIIVMACQYNL